MLKAALAGILLACLVVPAAAEVGTASWYGPGFAGRKTANGERFNPGAATCAHRIYRFGTVLRITNLRTGKSATCRVNDRGPYSGGRVLDVSKGVAGRLGMLKSGTARVRIERQ